MIPRTWSHSCSFLDDFLSISKHSRRPWNKNSLCFNCVCSLSIRLRGEKYFLGQNLLFFWYPLIFSHLFIQYMFNMQLTEGMNEWLGFKAGISSFFFQSQNSEFLGNKVLYLVVYSVYSFPSQIFSATFTWCLHLCGGYIATAMRQIKIKLF